MTDKRCVKVIPVCLFALTAAFLGYITVLSADDYWYSIFLRDGFANYIGKLREHYEIFNGRTFVHIIATLILHFGNFAFALFLPLTLLLAALCGAGFLGCKRRYGVVVVFLAGMFLIPRAMMVEGVLWISAFCNYTFPTAIVIALMYITDRRFLHGKSRWYAVLGALVLSFLCGASTEQLGIVACAFNALALLFAAVGRRNEVKLCAIQLFCSVFGLATIFLSPATGMRVVTESEGPIIYRIKRGFDMQAALFSDSIGLAVLILLVFVFFAVVLYKKHGSKIGFILLFLQTACLVLCVLTPPKTECYFYAGALALLCVAALLCFFKGFLKAGVLLFLSIVSVGVMIMTNSSGYRCFVPMYMLLLLPCGFFAAESLTHKMPFYIFIALVSVAAAVNVGLDSRGYLYNYSIEQINKQNVAKAAETGVLYYCIDYDQNYTHTKPYNNQLYFYRYKMSLPFDADKIKVYMYSGTLPAVYVNGELITSPAISDGNGGYMLPVGYITTQLGGRIDWNVLSTQITLGNTVYTYFYNIDDYHYRIVWIDSKGCEHRYITSATALNDYFVTYFPVSTFENVFGLTVQVTGNAIYVSD